MLNQTVKMHQGCRIVFASPPSHAHFYGYYYTSPLNDERTKLLCHRTSFDGRDVRADDAAEVGYFDLNSGGFHVVDETQAFNWQQGAMLQWLPKSGGRKVAYNVRVDNSHFGARIAEIGSDCKCSIQCPIYAIHPSGQYALGLNYERLYFCRPGYNYQGVAKEEWNCPIHPQDGIYRIDIKTGATSLLVRTQQFVPQKESLGEAHHWLEHAIWNPSGTRFAFLHRWATAGRMISELYTANASGNELAVYPKTGFYSHMGWKTDSSFSIWARPDTWKARSVAVVAKAAWYRALLRPAVHAVRAMRTPIRPHATAAIASWLLFTDPTGEWSQLSTSQVLQHDGHNSWTRDGRWMLTDTYEQEDGCRQLLLYDREQDRVVEIARFASRHNRTGYRCDLHPRWDPYEEWVVVDTSHYAPYRQIMVLDISDILKEIA